MSAQPPEFGAPDNATLTGLVFELASQLHVERTRRQALETALVARGLIGSRDIEETANSEVFRAANGAALDAAIRKLLRVMTESEDPRVPLRPEAAAMMKDGS
jgi:hypothetical protein